MKKNRIVLLLGLLIFLFGTKAVRAEELHAPCEGVTQLLRTNTPNGIEPKGGVIVDQVLQSVYGIDKVQNVVVFGQDKEEEGISITVRLKSLEGDLVHNESISRCNFSGEQNPTGGKCNATPGNSDDYETWKNNSSSHKKFYWESFCRPVRSHDAVRKIHDVSIWLQPSPATESWLGWLPGEEGGKATLRYLFPEKWMVGSWTDNGFVVTGTPDNTWSTTYYENWLQQMQGYNFLAGDTQVLNNLWSVTLVEVDSPGSPVVRSLGIFGPQIPSGGANPRDELSVTKNRIQYWLINSHTKLKKATSDPNSAVLPDPATEMTITLEHVPLDLPGKWFIGIQIEMEKATVEYTGASGTKTITESPDPLIWGMGDTQWFKEGDIKYTDPSFFFAYILLSTPCNPMEKDSCFDGST